MPFRVNPRRGTKRQETHFHVSPAFCAAFTKRAACRARQAALFQLFPCISLPQRGQVMTMRPFPFGTRHTAPHWGQVKQRWSLSIRCCRFPAIRRLMGYQTFSMKRAFSARRFSRLRENIRYSARNTMTVDRNPKMLYAAGCLSRRKILTISSNSAAQIMVRQRRSTPLRPYIKRESALPMR